MPDRPACERICLPRRACGPLCAPPPFAHHKLSIQQLPRPQRFSEDYHPAIRPSCLYHARHDSCPFHRGAAGSLAALRSFLMDAPNRHCKQGGVSARAGPRRCVRRRNDDQRVRRTAALSRVSGHRRRAAPAIADHGTGAGAVRHARHSECAGQRGVDTLPRCRNSAGMRRSTGPAIDVRTQPRPSFAQSHICAIWWRDRGGRRFRIDRAACRVIASDEEG